MRRPRAPTRKTIETAFYLQYGKTIGAWAALEHALSWWFHRLTRMPGGAMGITAGLYYSGRGFMARRDMLMAVLERANPRFGIPGLEASPDEETIKFLREAFKLAVSYSGARNQIVHRLAMFETNSRRIALVEGDHWSERGIDIEALKIMEANFRNLTNLLVRVYAPLKVKVPLTPQEALPLALAMPMQASSDQPRAILATRRRRR